MITRALSKIYSKSMLSRELYWLWANFWSIPALALVFLADIFSSRKIKIFRLNDSRIGHLASNTDLFLRTIKLKRDKNIYLGFVSSKPVNKQLVRVFKRKLRIITVPTLIYKLFFLGVINPNSWFGKSKFYKPLICIFNEYKEFNNTNSQVNLTKDEEERGKEILKDMGLKDGSWFVCFHSRDPSYLTKLYKNVDWTRHNFRDCSVESYLKAAEYVAKQKGYSLRMGAIVGDKMPNTNSRVIDYASKYRSDFGDVYLPAKCKFFLGNTAGLFLISTLFDIPVAHANVIPLKYPPLRKGDLFIPKKIWSKKKKRLLTFKEIAKSKVLDYYRSEDYEKAGLQAIENTPQEISDLAKEMNERIDGVWVETDEDKKMQMKFKSLFKKKHCEGFQSKIGTAFLRNNKKLLE